MKREVLASHAAMFITFLTYTMTKPYVLRAAESYGGALIGFASAIGSISAMAYKVFGVQKLAADSSTLLIAASLIAFVSFPLPLLGPAGYVAYEALNNFAFAIVLIDTLVVVAERTDPARLGFQYGIRGAALSLAGTIGPMLGVLLYTLGRLPAVLWTASLTSLLLILISRYLGGVLIHGKGEFNVSKRWLSAFFSSLLLASSFLIISTYLPPYQASIGIPHEVTSAFYSARAVGSGIVRIPAGMLADKASALISIPPLLAIIAASLSTHATTLSLSSLAGFLIGMSWGIASPVVLSTAGREKQKSKSLGLFTIGWDIANLTIVPLVGAISGNNYSIALSFSIVTSIMAIIPFVMLYKSLRS